MENFINNYPDTFALILFITGLWSLVWKALALWKSAKLNQKTWFVVLLIVNTVGILEIIYLLIYKKKKIV